MLIQDKTAMTVAGAHSTWHLPTHTFEGGQPMKFGLMYEIQIPEPHYDGIEQERYQTGDGPGGAGG